MKKVSNFFGFDRKEIMTSVIAVITICGAFGFFAAIAYMFRNNPVIVERLITFFQSIVMLVLAYYFGTSKSSSNKNDIIEKYLNKNINKEVDDGQK